jgi:hypothetical protein
MSAPAADFSGTVVVKMPFQLDVSGLTAELFGETASSGGFPIYVREPLPLVNLYDAATGAALIHYVQDICENSFTSVVNLAKVYNVKSDLLGALNHNAGYDVTKKGFNNLYMNSAPTPSYSTANNGGANTWLRYYSIEDFVLSYIANLIFGHPGALAPIANDSSIRADITAKVAAQMEKIYPLKGLAVDDATKPEYQDMSGVLLGMEADLTSTRYVRPEGMTAAQLNNIVQQFMNQAPARFIAGDKGVLQPLKFKAGDGLKIEMRIRDTSYKLSTPATNPTATANNAMFGANQAQTKKLNDNSLWKLEYTIA